MDVDTVFVFVGMLLIVGVDVWDIIDLRKEVHRLKAGNFTEEEFQNLCHNMKTSDRSRFEQGCREYQNKLFGSKGT